MNVYINLNLIILVLIFMILTIFIFFNNYGMEKFENEKYNNKPIIWSYWENRQTSTPEYIKLCFKTLHKHCDKNFNVIILNEKSVYDYLPDLRPDINDLKLALKVDYIRVALLKKYGGIWIDADTIVMKDLSDIIDKLKQHDFVGFGCSSNICFNGFPKPSNWTMASKKNGIIVTDYLNELNKKLDNNKKFNYFDLGKYTLWDVIKKYPKLYYHYDSKYDGTRDINGKWINVDNHISMNPTKLINENDIFFIPLENNKFMSNNPKYNFFIKLTEQQILNSNYWISQLFRKSLI